MYKANIAPISRKKIISSNEVPLFLKKRDRIWNRNGGFPRTTCGVKREDRLPVIRKVFVEHAREISELMHPNIRLVGGFDGWPDTSGWEMGRGELLAPSKELVFPKKGADVPPQASFDMSTLLFIDPSRELFTELAKLQKAMWGKKDGDLKSVVDYFNILCQRTGPTPIFIYFRDSGEVESAVFPIQVKTEDVTTWDGTTFNGTWKNDTILGDLLSCPMICSYMTIRGTSGPLIAEGVRPYAMIEIFLKFIDDCIAYSRPCNYGPENQHIPIHEHLVNDPNYSKFHARNLARMVCIVEGGSSEYDKKAGRYGFIAGYLERVLPDEKFLELLKGIVATVKKHLNGQ